MTRTLKTIALATALIASVGAASAVSAAPLIDQEVRSGSNVFLNTDELRTDGNVFLNTDELRTNSNVFLNTDDVRADNNVFLNADAK